VIFAATTVHGLFAGTDAGSPVLRLAYLAVSALVAALSVSRFRSSPARPAVAGLAAGRFKQ
jgi:hypothetical protein